jgi:nicotinamide riboside kinase
MPDRARKPLVIAVLGAESTGKSTLVRSLVPRLAAEAGVRVAGVPEVLREWCAARQRTPRREEQAAIGREQHRRIAAAAEQHDIVVSDTSALMTHVYSERLFGDSSLREEAVRLHRQVHVTLLTALDLPWVADGHQRDGEHVRVPVDDALRALLAEERLPFSVVAGRGHARADAAAAAIAPVLRSPGHASSRAESGLFTRLASQRNTPGAALWACTCCSVPELERALFEGGTPPRT